MLITACKAQAVVRMCVKCLKLGTTGCGLGASWTTGIEGDVLHSVLQKFQVHLDEDFNGNWSLPDNFSYKTVSCSWLRKRNSEAWANVFLESAQILTVQQGARNDYSDAFCPSVVLCNLSKKCLFWGVFLCQVFLHLTALPLSCRVLFHKTVNKKAWEVTCNLENATQPSRCSFL